ncbi:MAG: translocation/assembly module TamB domain-containing protein, partial [Candidatus Atribacteria bacterium]|nr:translocation/assembly module TamB domain-containing protein [Candidatus Atribacteria bacterium]
MGLFLWQEKDKLLMMLVQKLFDRIEKLTAVEISVKEVALRFPFSLEVKGISVQSNDFSLLASRGRICWNPVSSLHGYASRGKIHLELEDGELVTKSGNPLEWLTSFTFSRWPPFEVVLRKLWWKGNVPLEPLEVHLESLQNRLTMEIKNEALEMKGVLWEKKELAWEVGISKDQNRWKGRLDLENGLVHVESLNEKAPVVLDGQLSWHDNLITILGLTAHLGGWKFEGTTSIKVTEHFPLTVQGVMSGEKKDQSVTLLIQGESLSFPQDWVGEVQVQSPNEGIKAQGRFSLRGKEREVSLVLDAVSFPGMMGKGEVKGLWLGKEINFILQRFEVQLLGGNSFPQGKGLLTGKIIWNKEGWGGKLSFQGDVLTLDRLSIETPRVEVEIAPDKAPTLSGSGSIFGGSVNVVGSFRDGQLFLEGTARGMKLERLASLPVTGTVSGTLHIEAGKGKEVAEIALTEGELRWKEIVLGNITGGTIAYRGGKLAGEAIVLQRGSGWIKGNVEMEGEHFVGDLEASDYPFTYRWGGWDIGCLVQGKGHIAGSKEDWALDLSLSSSWTVGERKGTFTLRGALKDRTLTVDEFLCDWGEGWVKLAGEVEMYRRVNLAGEVSRLIIPVNPFGWSGELHSLRFTFRGPWQEVDFSCEAEGEKFAIQEKPLGEELTLRMEGTLPLPGNNAERMTLAQYFDPRYFRAGEIRIRGVRLASLGIDFLRRYRGEGILDLVFRLQPETKQWNFMSENLSLAFPGYVNFEGEMAGVYDGEELRVDRLTLRDVEKHLAIQGQGKLGVKEKTLDFRLQGEMDTVFSFKDGRWVFRGKGQGEIVITGTTEDPSVQGKITVTQGEILRGNQKYASFTNVQAKLDEGVLHILSAKGIVGETMVDIDGVLSSKDVNLHGRIEGTVLSPDLAKVLKGMWSGNLKLDGTWDDLKLRGELVLQNGLMDLREAKGMTSQVFIETLQQWEQSVPLTVELILSTADILEVKTRFIDLQLKGALRVTGKGSNLLAEGKLEVEKGTYDLVFVKFPLTGYVFFNHFGALEPQLSLEGEKEVGRYRIRLSAEGSLSDYTITMTSEPPLSQEEILSLLFLGDEDAYLALENV